MSEKQLQQLPSVSEVLLEVNKSITLHDNYLKEVIKTELSGYRRMAKAGKLDIKRRAVTAAILDELDSLNQSSIKNIINGTGVVLHTGFGRAPISKKVISTVAKKTRRLYQFRI
jgi:L-seryl-tRNA(Ser) seleniumtransferase